MPKLPSITFSEFTVKDYFAFSEEIVNHDGKRFMDSLDADSLFTYIPLEETINICTNLLYDNVDIIEAIEKFEFENMLSLATRETYSLQTKGQCGHGIALRTYYCKCFFIVL